jgi:NAD(P)-dependent dehydrogenase (short-subunit alcohol dehydrogenase family)
MDAGGPIGQDRAFPGREIPGRLSNPYLQNACDWSVIKDVAYMSEEMKLESWITTHVPEQSGKRVIVTGATSGIGWETARVLAQVGAEVVLAARDDPKGQDAVRRIREVVPTAHVRHSKLDLSSLESVRDFASREADQPLDILINNAGAMASMQRKTTVDGFERTLGTNFFGPFALTGLLLPALLMTQAPRIVTVASAAAKQGKLDLKDIGMDKRYALNPAYSRSKLADLIFAVALQRKIQRSGVPLMSVACHPGYAITNLQNSELSLGIKLIAAVLKPIASHDAAHGALPTLYAATSNEVKAGGYYGPCGFLQAKGFPTEVAIPARALDESLASELWMLSEKLTGVRYSELTGSR